MNLLTVSDAKRRQFIRQLGDCDADRSASVAKQSLR